MSGVEWELYCCGLFSDFGSIQNIPHDGTSGLLFIPINVIHSFLVNTGQRKEGKK